MLSNETAVGKYPIKAVQMFAKVATQVEDQLKTYDHLLPVRQIHNAEVLLDALGLEICQIAEKTKADKKGEIQLADAIQEAIKVGKTVAVELQKNEKRIDVGTPESYMSCLKDSYKFSSSK